MQCAAPPLPPLFSGIMASSIHRAFPFGPHIERACWQYEGCGALFFKVHWMPSDSYPVTERRNYADSWQKFEKIFQMKKVLPAGKTFFVYWKASRFASISASSSWEGPSGVFGASAGTICLPAIMDSRAALAISSTIARSWFGVCVGWISIWIFPLECATSGWFRR